MDSKLLANGYYLTSHGVVHIVDNTVRDIRTRVKRNFHPIDAIVKEVSVEDALRYILRYSSPLWDISVYRYLFAVNLSANEIADEDLKKLYIIIDNCPDIKVEGNYLSIK